MTFMPTGDATDKLPVELLQDILLNVQDRSDVLRSSLVSKRWRSIAIQDRRYYLAFRKDFIRSDWGAVERMHAIALHAVQHGFRLTINIRIDNEDWQSTSTLRRYLDTIGTTLKSSFSNIVKLGLTLTSDEYAILALSLNVCAPQLQKLLLSADDKFRPSHCAVPAYVFAGVAPSLQTVTLVEIGLGAQPIPAFRHVSRLAMEFNSGDAVPSVVSQQTMPKLRELKLSTWDSHGVADARLVEVVDLNLTQLTLLNFADCNMFNWVSDDVLRCADSVVLGVQSGLTNLAHLSRSLDVSGAIALEMSIMPDFHHLQWRLHNEATLRTISLEWQEARNGTFGKIIIVNDIGRRVTRICIYIPFLPEVLKCGQSLQTLRELEIYLTGADRRWAMWPCGFSEELCISEWEDDTPNQTEWTVQCPHLERVRVSAPQEDTAQVKVEMLELLSIALGIGGGETPTAVSLVLAFVEVDGGLARSIGRFSTSSYLQ